MLRVSDCIRDGIRPGVPKPTEWQRIRDEIDAAMIFTRSDLRKRVVSSSTLRGLHRPNEGTSKLIKCYHSHLLFLFENSVV